MDVSDRSPLPPLSVEGVSRLDTLLNRPITLRGQNLKVPLLTTTLKELFLQIHSFLPPPVTLSLFGSSVLYLVDGDYSYSLKCLPKSDVGGYRPNPHDFDFSFFAPKANNECRWEVYKRLVSWVSSKIMEKSPGYYIDKKELSSLLTGSIWNCRDSNAINQFLFFGLSDTSNNRYEIRITEKLGLPYLFSIERIQVIFDATFSRYSLSPDNERGLECINHWNQGIATVENIELMDPLAWVKMISKICRGILFKAEDRAALTQRAMNRSLWPARGIDTLEKLISKGFNPDHPKKNIPYTFHAYRFLPEGEFHPFLNDLTLPKGDSLSIKILGWIAKNCFRGNETFKSALLQLSYYAAWAYAAYPKGVGDISFRLVDSELILKLGEKRSDLCLFIPWSNPFTAIKPLSELEAIFQLSATPLNSVMKREWEERLLISEKNGDEFFTKFRSFNWNPETIPPWVFSRLLELPNIATFLIPFYPFMRGSREAAELLNRLQNEPFETALFKFTADTLNPEELNYLKKQFNGSTAPKILFLVDTYKSQSQFINDYLKPSYESIDLFMSAFFLSKAKKALIIKHFFVYGDKEESIELHFEPSNNPESMTLFYQNQLEKGAYPSLDHQLAYLKGVVKLFPTIPNWLTPYVLAFIDKDVADPRCYFYHWFRGIPSLSDCFSSQEKERMLPSLNFERFKRTADRLLKASEAHHLIHLLSLIGIFKNDKIKNDYLTNIFQESLRKISRISTDTTNERYLLEASMDAIDNILEKNKSINLFMGLWKLLDEKVKYRIKESNFSQCFELVVLQLKLFDCYYKNFKISNLSNIEFDLSNELILNFMNFYNQIDDTSFYTIHHSFLLFWNNASIQKRYSEAPPSLIVNTKQLDAYEKSLKGSCTIM